MYWHWYLWSYRALKIYHDIKCRPVIPIPFIEIPDQYLRSRYVKTRVSLRLRLTDTARHTNMFFNTKYDRYDYNVP